MAEYAGYVASAPVNYGEITKDLVNNFIAIDQANREQQRKTQAELDKNYSSDLDKMTEFKLTQSPTFNDAISPIADGSKAALYRASKSGNMQEYNRIKANLKTGLNNIASARDVIAANFDEIKKSVSKGEVSPIGAVYAEMYQDAVDFSNGGFTVMPDGTIPYVKYDRDGKIESTSSFYDPSMLTTTKPFIDPSVDYEKNLNDWMRNIGSHKDEQGNVTIISPLNNPAFPKAKQTKIAELTSTDRNTARFLTTVGGYVGYRNDAQKEELLKDGDVTEDKLIKVELKNGMPQPILTDKQRKAAKLLAEEQIDQRVDFTRTFDEPRPVKISVGNKSDKLTQGEENIISIGESADEIYNDIKLRGANTKFTKDILNGVLGKFGAANVPAGIKLKLNKAGGVDIVTPTGAVFTSINRPEDIVQILGGKSPLEAKSIYNRYRKEVGASAPTTKTKPKAADNL